MAVRCACVRVLAIVNGNARRATARTCARLARVVPGRVIVTHALADARAALYAELARGLDLVVFGGGDGTVVMGLALLAEACRGLGRGEPAIAVLRLGTGDAFARALGATTDPDDDLARLARGDGRWRPQPLVDVLGLRSPFAGLGIDAQLLEDHAAVGRVVDRIPGARRVVSGAARYALSVALRSLPRIAVAGPGGVRARVRNLGAPAIAMTATGAAGAPIAAGEVLWEGPATLLAAATIPYFGFGLRMFPFAETRADRFHLRCGSAGVAEILRSTPAAFRGTYFSDSVRDFLCDRVRIEVVDGDDGTAAIEAGGELVGRHAHVELGLAAPITVAALADRDQR